jgi:hypothetical protein
MGEDLVRLNQRVVDDSGSLWWAQRTGTLLHAQATLPVGGGL